MKTFFKILIIVLIVLILLSVMLFFSRNIRQPAVAGSFYSEDRRVLQNQINTYLDNVEDQGDSGVVKAIMVPHAGYEFSGETAAKAYSTIVGQDFDTVIILANSHQEYFSGMVIDGHDFWQTPLGKVELDKKLIAELSERSNIRIDSELHKDDHVIEVQLPFLQTVLPGKFKIVPILFGNKMIPTYRFLKPYLTDKTLIVASSDLSHYPSYSDANSIDNKTLEEITKLNITDLALHSIRTMDAEVPGVDTIACSEDAIRTVMVSAQDLNWKAKILGYKNSGDRLGYTKDQVVGYGSMVFYSLADLTSDHREELLEIAKESIKEYVMSGQVKDFNIADPRLLRPEGVFVSLYKDDYLRGCIGKTSSLGEPLWENVRGSAIMAAVKDNRFLSVNPSELEELSYEVSVLSELKKIDSWQDFELGKQGVLIRKGQQEGLFLPQVADQTDWDKEEFLSHLCTDKAGLAPDAYKNDPDVELFVFTAQVFADK